MDNINAYNEALFKEEFPTTEYYKIIKDLYPNATIYYGPHPWAADTQPRKGLDTRNQLLLDHNIISAMPFYYLKYINQNATVYDLGCGYNFFKPFFKNLIGIDPYIDESDIKEIVDDKFYEEHQSCYEAVFSINALHFVPIHNIREVCEKFALMLKPGCTGFLALNVSRMLEWIEKVSENNKWSPLAPGPFLETWVRKQLDNFPYKLDVIDIDLTRINNFLNGNIRLVITR